MENSLTQGNIAKSLLHFTVPLILSGMFQQVFNWVDAFIVGNAEGELALAGIGATTSIYNLFVTVMIGFTSGISVLTAQAFGMGEKERIQHILSAFSILLGGVFCVAAFFGISFAREILMILDTPAGILGIAKAYMQLLLTGIPFLAIYNSYSAVLRGIGDSKAPFLSVLVCSAANVVLDILFVIILQLGAAGAGAATTLSQIAMTLFVVLYTVRKYPPLRFRLDRRAIDRTVIRQGLRFGVPPAVQAGTTSVGNIMLQRFMNGFGEQVVAAITTAYRVDSVIILPIINFGSGIATIVAQNIGAGKPVRAKKVLRTGIIMIAFISVGLTGLVIAAGETIIRMFGLTPEPVKIGGAFFSTIAYFYIVYGFAMAMRGYLEGAGDLLFSGASGITALIVRIASSYLFVSYFDNMVIAYAEAFSWMVLLMLYLIRFLVRQKNS